MSRRVQPAAVALACWLLALASSATAQETAVLDVRFTPSPRAQVAIWIEAEDGTFLRTLGLTEAVAFRGIGNRPGASEMNSGYRWPYGRREGVLPIWARRRAAGADAALFPRVIFQNRTWEGLASRTSTDQSVDDYFCLSFNRETTTRDALDAVSCASVFTSDKGRYLTEADVSAGYGEPYEDPITGEASSMPLPLKSLYPPRMDVLRCGGSGTACNDHPDVARFGDDVRDVIPEIDAITMATAPGFVEQSVLFTVPQGWPRGRYLVWLEVHVEGDYNATFNATTYPTPTGPSGQWDSWAMTYGYPYRGQPSVAYRLPVDLGDEGEQSFGTSTPEGSSSWRVWSAGYGALQPMTGIEDDAARLPGSGADRLLGDGGDRLTVVVSTLGELPEPVPGHEPWTGSDVDPADGAGGSGADPASPDGPMDAMEDAPAASGEPAQDEPRAVGTVEPEPEPAGDEPTSGGRGVILDQGSGDSPVGPVRDLQLLPHDDALHTHEWIRLRMRAAESDLSLHRYEVRVSTRPIVDEATFLRNGRPAKTATDDPEGAVSLQLPPDTAPGEWIESEVGDLIASTLHYVAVRAVDRLNRPGPISVAEIRTTKRTFATVTPCVVATASYGTPLAHEVRVLRRLRDRHLSTSAFGRALVGAYYRWAPPLADFIAARPRARAAVRGLLEPVVWLAERALGEPGLPRRAAVVASP